jgi:3-deoxy-D-manno-octulosonate 8-phosphate phosphatase (KDO 8-P phosphatase)
MNRHEKLNNIRLFIFDLEGTIISGDCAFDQESGEREKLINSLSKFAEAAKEKGIRTAVITGRERDGLIDDLKKLDADICAGAVDKITPAENLLEKYGLTYEQTAFAGDDILDLPLLGKAGLKIVPSTARREVKRSADIVLGEPEELLAALTEMLNKTGLDNPDEL